MNKRFCLRKEDAKPKWRIIDADGRILGRLASEVAVMLTGKRKGYYTPHVDCGDYVVVINASKVKLTGKKLQQKEYIRHSGWIGGKKIRTAGQLMQTAPEKLIEHAVHGMLPKSILGRAMGKKLRVYAGAEHPHIAQLG